MYNIFFYDKYKNVGLIKDHFTINRWIDGYVNVNHKKIKNLKLYGRIIEINKLSIDEIQRNRQFFFTKKNKSYQMLFNFV